MQNLCCADKHLFVKMYFCQICHYFFIAVILLIITSGNWSLFVYKCRLLITFANSLDPDQVRQNVGPDLDPNCSDTLMVFQKEYFEKVDFEKKNQQTTKKYAKYTVGKACKKT